MNNEAITRETIKQMVEDFLTEHDQNELNVTVYLDSSGKKPICNFHIETYLIMLIRHNSNSYNLPVLASLVAEITGTYDHTQIICDFYKNKFWVLPHINFTIDPQ